ncbi:Hypothetical protein SMAX5B_010358 [Scophthalmus maximus]|uniref:Uncharacterized protein n=1 Tax=Scophthalmus maximus TaxID=52904 RepID=A0A2U9BTG1_SCOMX|nr:Hypothetical protein SMAX5B_010358 [Scophthalmus maximus]
MDSERIQSLQALIRVKDGRNVDLALCSENTAKNSKPPTSFSTAETGNLQLARSAVLNCVTGAKWLTVLVSAGNAVQQDLTYRL